MYDAMKILGLNPIHSGYFTEVRDPLCHYLFGNSSLDGALGVLEGFDAAMDEPFMLMYEEIMSAFPESKFLLTISDGESWFNMGLLLSQRTDVCRTTIATSSGCNKSSQLSVCWCTTGRMDGLLCATSWVNPFLTSHFLMKILS
eukprot:Skav202673  [mRNA]  locus=scaffold1791:457827:460965:+ [translate_table: standard]